MVPRNTTAGASTINNTNYYNQRREQQQHQRQTNNINSNSNIQHLQHQQQQQQQHGRFNFLAATKPMIMRGREGASAIYIARWPWSFHSFFPRIYICSFSFFPPPLFLVVFSVFCSAVGSFSSLLLCLGVSLTRYLVPHNNRHSVFVPYMPALAKLLIFSR